MAITREGVANRDIQESGRNEQRNVLIDRAGMQLASINCDAGLTRQGRAEQMVGGSRAPKNIIRLRPHPQFGDERIVVGQRPVPKSKRDGSETVSKYKPQSEKAGARSEVSADVFRLPENPRRRFGRAGHGFERGRSY